MRNKNLYLKFITHFGQQPEDVIANNIGLLLEYDAKHDNIPYANNGTREEMEDVYTDEDLETIYNILIKGGQTGTNNTHISSTIKTSTTDRLVRSDSLNNITNQLLINKQDIIDKLLEYQTSLYNPVCILNKINQTHKRFWSIFRFSDKFLERCKFINTVYYGTTRKIKGQIILCDEYNKGDFPLVTREDIVDVNLKFYSPLVRAYILKGNFNMLILK